jgi:glycosyltransferase involved in cell wall biosynthesis
MIGAVCMVVHSHCPDDPRVRREAEALASRGTRVDVLCLRNPGERAAETVEGVRYLRLPVRRRRGSVVRYLLEYATFFALAAACSLWLALRRRYDVFQAHNMPDVLIFCGLPHRLRGAKLVLDLHDLMPEVYVAKYDLAERSLPVRILRAEEAASVGAADLALTTSKAFLRTLADRTGRADKLRIVLNSPDERIFPEPAAPAPRRPGAFRLVYHGTLVHRSGLDVALRAVHRVRPVVPELELSVFGDGDAEGECRRLAGELGLAGIVRFGGHRPIEEIPAHVEVADVGLVPNRENVFTARNLPTRIFEYLRMRKPVIAARTPGVEDYFGPDGLLYFRPGDPEDLARAILEAHRDPANVRAVLERGIAVYERHRWANERERYLALLEALAAGTPLPAE